MTLSEHSFELQTFDALSSDQLYQILQLRNQVFILEQDCPYLDVDGLDPAALHVIGNDDQQDVVAYARILTPAQNNQAHCSIGRVVVAQQARHLRMGQHLMQAAIKACQSTFPDHSIKISAQTYLTQFYQKLGFISTQKHYLEDDIPHVEMMLHH